MNLDLHVGYWGAGVATDPWLVLEAERLGYRCVWVAEAYGSDAATVLGSLATQTSRIELGSGIFQMPARTPAMTAMTAATLDDLSGGRFRLGLGLSGPQVVEGWHGVAYGKPLSRTREYVSIVRKVLSRQEPLVHSGEEYRVPLTGPGTTGLGKPLKLIGSAHPEVPIYLAAIGPRNVALAAEIADGWLPVFYSPERAPGAFAGPVREGFDAAGDADRRERFDVAPTVQSALDDDLDRARDQVRPYLALYIGGMGARGTNFYNDLAVRYGFEEAAAEVQTLYLEGRKQEAIAAVPDRLVDEVCLVGPREALRDRLDAWRESDVTTIVVGSMDPGTLRALAELVL